MAGEEQYYNPIIQAMIASAQNRRAIAQQAIEKDKNEQDRLFREQAAKTAADQFKQQHDMQLRAADLAEKQLGLQRQEHELHLHDQKLRISQALQKWVQEGGKPEAFLNQMGLSGLANPAATGNTLPLNPNIDVANLGPNHPDYPGPPTLTTGLQTPLSSLDISDPQAEANRIKTLMEAQAAGTEKGKAPYEEAKDARKLAHDKELLGLKGEADLKHLQAQGVIQRDVANINGLWHLRGALAAHQQTGADPNVAKQLVDGVFNGTTDMSKLPIDQKRAVEAYAAANGEAKYLPTNFKKYSDALTSVSSVQELMNTLNDLATNYSRDSPGNLSKGNQEFNLPIIGTVGRVQPGSELQSKQDTLAGLAGRFAQFFDNWSGRKSNQEILRQIQGVFNPKATMKDNLQKIEDHKKVLQQNIREMFPGFKPERINQILSDHNINAVGAFGDDKSEYIQDSLHHKNGVTIGKKYGSDKWYNTATGEEIK